jgi:hypothetical protein
MGGLTLGQFQLILEFSILLPGLIHGVPDAGRDATARWGCRNDLNQWVTTTRDQHGFTRFCYGLTQLGKAIFGIKKLYGFHYINLAI